MGGPDGSCWAGDEARSAVSVRGVIGGALAGCCCCPLVMFTAAETRRGGGMVIRLNNSADPQTAGWFLIRRLIPPSPSHAFDG